jgi:hypothetical protein
MFMLLYGANLLHWPKFSDNQGLKLMLLTRLLGILGFASAYVYSICHLD